METNVIYNQNCFDTMKEHIKEKTIDCILTSPPYNMTKRKGGFSDTGRYDVYQDWMTEEEYVKFSIELFNKFDEVVKQNGTILYNLSFSKENGALPYITVSEISKNTPWVVVDTIVWEKTNALPSPADMRHSSRKCELIYVFARKTEKETFNRYPGISSVGKNGQTYYHTYDNIIKAKNNDTKTTKLNQATYSSDLCIQLLNLYTQINDIVYDPFMGTGTTANACVIRNRKYIGSEISLQQCEYANQRINKTKEDLMNL